MRKLRKGESYDRTDRPIFTSNNTYKSPKSACLNRLEDERLKYSKNARTSCLLPRICSKSALIAVLSGLGFREQKNRIAKFLDVVVFNVYKNMDFGHKKGLVQLSGEQCCQEQPTRNILDSLKPTAYGLLLIFVSMFSLSDAWAQSGRTLSGVVRSAAEGQALEGVSIRLDKQQTTTDKNGQFKIWSIEQEGSFEVKHLGYKTQQIAFDALSTVFDIQLEADENYIEEVEVVSTGYQSIPKERATGSFAHVNSEMLNRNPSMNILSRLDGITNGLLLDQNTGNPDRISVRGRSTLFSSTRPLIVVDNFPFEGDISNISPNDIESVTVLKDAAAASIWGVRSGNGVIVITTKKAKDRFRIDFSSNLLVAKKPDLFYAKQMSSSEFIDVEKLLFEQGEYDRDINTIYKNISPVVNLLHQQRLGELSEDEVEAELDKLRENDVRNDLQRYFYRPKFQHQQQISISSGGERVKNVLSLGYDRSQSESITTDNERFNLRNSNQWTPFKDYLQIDLDVWYSRNVSNERNASGYTPMYPYEKLVDDDGNALEASTLSTLRKSYTDTAGRGYLLDWKFRPLEEAYNGLNHYKSNDQQLRYQIGLSSRPYRSFNLQLSYLASNNWMQNATLYDEKSYYTRNTINQFSQIDYNEGIVIRPIPLGSILNEDKTKSWSHYGRAQVNWNEKFGSKHHLTGLLGIEWRQDKQMFDGGGYVYGYDPFLETFAKVDTYSYFPYYHSGLYGMISEGRSRLRRVDNNRSLYALMSYSYAEDLIFTGSIRKDESNIFGVSANKKGVPLWSIGASYNFQSLLNNHYSDYIKLRTSFGYNGNVDKNTTALLTSKLWRSSNIWGRPLDLILNPPNNSLRWERIQNMNIGIDFSLLDGWTGGSIEFFVKNGKDLMGHSPVAPQVGVSQFYGNVASTSTKGVDIQMYFTWLKRNNIDFRTDIIFNGVKDKVTDYYINPGSNTDIVTNSGIVPIVGYPINSLVLYKFMGLDSHGDPTGSVDGNPSTSYSNIINGDDRESIIFLGSKVPTRFGAIRNTISYQKIELSFNITYKFGYYFRNSRSFSSQGLIGGSYKYSDYENRWQNVGDELYTNVPKFVYPRNINREAFYQNSSVLGVKGDHIRLQDVRISYSCNPLRRQPGSKLSFYLYATNIGLIWKHNAIDVDPHFLTGYKRPLELSFGTSFNF